MNRLNESRSARGCRIAHRSWLALGFGLLAAWTAASPAQADSWATPAECKHGVTGTEFGDPPVVEYYANTQLTNGTVRSVSFNGKGQGVAQVYVTSNSQSLYLLVVTYSPFLIGSLAFNVNFSGSQLINIPLPAAGYSPNKQSKVYDTINVTITDPNTKQPMPGASVMWAPYFAGADPYVTTTDSKGQIQINCFQTLPAGNPIYVVSADGKTEFSTVVTATSTNLKSTSSTRRRSSNPPPNIGIGGNH